MTTTKPFCAVSYFEGQSDACDMFAKQFDRYMKAAKNKEASDFCEKTIEWLGEMQKRFAIEAKMHELK